jgi:enamine deaminase RidA (YjgF/YER057c/UK114 family)
LDHGTAAVKCQIIGLENDFERTKGRDFQGSDQIERAVKKSDLICEYIGTLISGVIKNTKR